MDKNHTKFLSTIEKLALDDQSFELQPDSPRSKRCPERDRDQ